MEKLIKIVLISSKRQFLKLKEKSPYICKSINKDVSVTNIFLKHISGYSKNRKTREIVERLSILSLIEEILLNGTVFQEKENMYYEKHHFFKKTYKISLYIEGIYFLVLVGEKKNGNIIILSCFVKHLKEDIKKD